jgi:hypothetical protein
MPCRAGRLSGRTISGSFELRNRFGGGTTRPLSRLRWHQLKLACARSRRSDHRGGWVRLVRERSKVSKPDGAGILAGHKAQKGVYILDMLPFLQRSRRQAEQARWRGYFGMNPLKPCKLDVHPIIIARAPQGNRAFILPQIKPSFILRPCESGAIMVPPALVAVRIEIEGDTP